MCDELKTTSNAAETKAASIQSPVTGPSFVGVAHTSRAKVLRTISGQTAGVDQRRGSFLVLVVGVLALLSVIAVLYATLGSSDRSRAQAVVRKQILDDYPAKVGDYISGVIAADALDIILERVPSPGQPRFVVTRESFDYPFTDWRSTNQNVGLTADKPLFTPTGGPARDASGAFIGPMPTSWTPSDPYLAATEPTFFDVEGLSPALADMYRERRDWAHITNVSPDGRSVNLALLRGNFDIASRLMTAGLTIPGPIGGNFEVPLGVNSHVPAFCDSRQIGAYRPMFDSFNPGDPRHIHNQWADADGDGFADSRWFQMVDARNNPLGTTPLNEIAVIPHDSSIRYFVAARIIDLSGLVNVNTATDQMSPPDGAVLINGVAVDLSRLIGSSPADVSLRELLTLAYQKDVGSVGPTASGSYDDLHVTADRPDAAQQYTGYDFGQAHASGHFAYQAIKLSLAANAPVPPADTYQIASGGGGGGGGGAATPWVDLALGGYDPATGQFVFSFAQQRGISAVEDRQSWDFDQFINGSPMTGAQARYQSYVLRNNATRATGVVQNPTTPGSYIASNIGLFAEADLLELMTYFGANDSTIRSSLEMVTGGRDGVGSGPDYSPLRDNRELFNERPERLFSLAADPDQYDRFMLARFLDVRQRITTTSFAREIRMSADVAPDRLSDGEARINPVSLLSDIELRSRLSGPDANGQQSDLEFNKLLRAYYTSLAPYVGEGNNGTNVNVAWDDPDNDNGGSYLAYGHQGAEFALITSAFMAANIVDKFDLNGIPTAKTLILEHDARFGGGVLDNDRQQPPEAQVFPYWHRNGGDADVNDVVRTEDSNAILTDANDPAKASKHLLKATTGRNDIVNSPAINIYGVEAQPFVTGVTMFTVYTDAPVSAGQGADQEAGSGPLPGSADPVTINGDIDVAKSDFVMRCVAFQLTNPFNTDIQLGANEFTYNNGSNNNPTGMNFHWLDVGDEHFPPFTRLGDYFYLEFGGRQYALVSLEEQRNRAGPLDPGGPNKSGTNTGYYTELTSASEGIDVVARPIIIPAGESIVVYSLSQIPRSIMQRMSAVDGTYMDDPRTDPVVNLTIPRNQSPYQFHDLIRKHIAEKDLGIGRPTTVSQATPGDGRYGHERDGVYWIPEFFSPADTSALPNNVLDEKLGKPGFTTGAPNLTTGIPFKTLKDYNAAPGSQWSTPFGDLMHATASPSEKDVVTLWRALRTGPTDPADPLAGDAVRAAPAVFDNMTWWDDSGQGYTPPANTFIYEHNLRNNDLMVDRFRLPTGSDFNQTTRLQAGNRPIAGTDANTGDDTGYTITLWDSAHRPADPDADDTASRIRSGSLPAYCMERKVRDVGGINWNTRIQDDVPDSPNPTLNRGYFEDGGASSAAGAGDAFRKWFDKPNDYSDSSNNVVVEAVGVAPWRRDPSGTNGINTASRANVGTGGVEKPDFNIDRPELVLNNARYSLPLSLKPDLSRCTLRTADMLAPLAVGAMFDPLAPTPTNWASIPGMRAEDIRWTPLSESFCLAMGYETAPVPDVPCALVALYPRRNIDPTNPNSLFVRLFDKAQLKLDQYAAFFDEDNDGVFTPPANAASDLEYLRGPQTPVAWNVLDTFSTRAGASINDVTQGAVNINTASQAVIATLPMVAPPTLAADPFMRPDPATGNPRPSWWWLLPPTGTTGVTVTTDLSATIVSVRDKIKAYFRTPSVTTFGDWISFDESATTPLGDYSAQVARTFMGNFAEMGEVPGFRTPGSILMARAQSPDPSTPVDPAIAALPHNIDSLGRDETAPNTPAESSRLGVTPGLTRNWDSANNRWVASANLAPNDYQEQLAVAGAVVGSTTNRSDVFAVWFIVQGYTKEDVTGLAPTDPMVPSVKRRFVMVVDRSNVRQVGDKPKILLMKEVPVD
jgi:hypothetical protein